MSIYHGIESLIGNTPLFEAKNYSEALDLNGTLLVKLERFNPAGSVKDRAALYMINDAEKRGLLKKGGTVVEPTSGNTGIAICALCAARGYAAIIVMPDNMSAERVKCMAAYGAKIVLTPAKFGMKGAIEEAAKIREATAGAITLGQFENAANARAHYETTGREILRDCDGSLDYFVAGVGTGGTISGVGKFLKVECPNVKVVAVQPRSSPVLTGGDPAPHKIQGIGPNFVPRLFDRSIVDGIYPCTDGDAYEASRLFAQKEGILVGISSGAALHAAAKILKRNPGKRVVCIAPDSGERYLSTALYF